MQSIRWRKAQRPGASVAALRQRFVASVWLLFAGLAVIALAAALVLLTGAHAVDHARLTAAGLAQVSDAIEQEQMIVTNKVGDGVIAPGDLAIINHSSAALDAALVALQQRDEAGVFTALWRAAERYQIVVASELALLGVGQSAEAQSLADTEETPASADLLQRLAAQRRRATDAVATARGHQRWGAATAVIVSGLLSAALVWRFVAARRRRAGAEGGLSADQALVDLRLREALLNHVHSSVVALAPDLTIRYWNRHAESVYGWTAAEALGRSVVDVLGRSVANPDSSMSPLELAQHIRQTVATAGYWEGETLTQRKDALPFVELLSVSAITTSDGQFVGAAEVAQNLSQFKGTEQALRDSEAGFRFLFANNPLPMWVVDLDTLRYLEVNEAAVSRYGYSRDEFLGMKMTDIRPPGDAAALQQAIAADHDKAAPSSQRVASSDRLWRHRLKDGRLIDVEISWHDVHFGDHRHASLVVAQDVTERVKLTQQLERRAYYDALTGLPNRALFTDRLRDSIETAVDNAGLVAVLFLDLDNFKVINDSLGHERGDELLGIVAERLRRVSRERDTVARFGGDEFVVLLDDLPDLATALEAGARLAEAVHQPLMLAEHTIMPSCSIGVAVSQRGQETVDILIGNADAAMYEAKAQGKDQIALFQPEMRRQAVNRLNVEHSLREALGREEFELHYQPIVALDDRSVREVEALVRWRHPVRGLLAPDQFIALAEQTGLIVPLGYWVLTEACRQAAHWQTTLGTAVVVGVNLSARQFQDALLVDHILATLAAAELTPGSLKLEVTESVLMHDLHGAAAQLQRLKQVGVRLAIDDFGTGYSSLSYLKQLPVDTLKIDRSFVSGLPGDFNDEAIVRSILGLARDFGLSVTAEGIETDAQAMFLQTLGCNRGQGYLFAKPQPAARVARFLAADLPPRQSDAGLIAV